MACWAYQEDDQSDLDAYLEAGNVEVYECQQSCLGWIQKKRGTGMDYEMTGNYKKSRLNDIISAYFPSCLKSRCFTRMDFVSFLVLFLVSVLFANLESLSEWQSELW